MLPDRHRRLGANTDHDRRHPGQGLRHDGGRPAWGYDRGPEHRHEFDEDTRHQRGGAFRRPGASARPIMPVISRLPCSAGLKDVVLTFGEWQQNFAPIRLIHELRLSAWDSSPSIVKPKSQRIEILAQEAIRQWELSKWGDRCQSKQLELLF